MIYLLGAFVLVLIVTGIYMQFLTHHDKKQFFIHIGLLVLLLIFTYASKVLFVYKPLLLLHLALVMVAWWYYYRYIKRDSLFSYWILSPALSVALFVLTALFFRENG